MSYSSFNPYVGNYPVAQTNNPQAYYNQPRNNVQGYSQAQYNQTTYYPQQQVPSYYDRREVIICREAMNDIFRSQRAAITVLGVSSKFLPLEKLITTVSLKWEAVPTIGNRCELCSRPDE